MGLVGIFRSRDKPKNGTNGSAYPFMWGYSASGKRVNERTSMQMTAVYSCVPRSGAFNIRQWFNSQGG